MRVFRFSRQKGKINPLLGNEIASEGKEAKSKEEK
jgi:hypothetical protein